MTHFPALALALRSLRARPTRTLLTMAGIVLGVAVILAISVTNRSTLASVNSVFTEASGRAQLVVTSSDDNGKGFAASVAQRVEAVSGVAAAVPVLRVQTILTDREADAESVGFLGRVGGGVLFYGIDPAQDLLARDYKIVAGDFLHPGAAEHAVILVADYAADKDIKVGNDIYLLTPDGSMPVKVVGLMSKEGPGQLNNGAFGVLSLRVAQDLFSRMGDVDQIDVVAAPTAASGDALDDLKNRIQERLGDEFSVTYPATQSKRVTQMLDVYQMGLNFFSVTALFVGAFLIYNAFSMTVVERTREIGMLRTIGMTQRQVTRQILVEAILLGILGVILGVFLGLVLSQGLIRGMEALTALELKQVTVKPDSILLSAGVGLVVAMAASLIPAWQAGRISPLEALRARGKQDDSWLTHKGWRYGLGVMLAAIVFMQVDILPPEIDYPMGSVAIFALFVGATMLIPATVDLWERVTRPAMQRLYGNEGRLGSSNIQRSRFRTALTVASLMTGVAMILSIRGLTDAFSRDIEDWIQLYVGGDLYVHSELPLRTHLAERLDSVDGVLAVTPIRYLDTKWTTEDGSNEDLIFMAVDPQSYTRVSSFSFTSNQGDPEALKARLAAGEAVFVSSVLAEMNDLEQGDYVRLRTGRGVQDFLVAGVIVDFYNQGRVVVGSWKDMRRFFGINDVSAFMLRLAPDSNRNDVIDRIDVMYGASNHLTIESNEAITNQALRVTTQAFSMFDVLAYIAIIVAALGVINTLTMNVLERTRELGMLRGLGMTRRQVAKMILAEAALMGLIGGVFGVFFGLFLSRLILQGAAATQGYQLAYVLPTQGIIVGFFIAIVVSQLAALWPARRAASISVIEAIQFE